MSLSPLLRLPEPCVPSTFFAGPYYSNIKAQKASLLLNRAIGHLARESSDDRAACQAITILMLAGSQVLADSRELRAS